MHVQKILGSLAILLESLLSRPAVAAEASCSLKLVNTIPLTMAAGGARPLLSVSINGAEKKFLLDTGGVVTQISPVTAEELKLPITDANLTLLDAYGKASTKTARVDSFQLGRLRDTNTDLPLMTHDSDLFAGLLSANYLGRYDVELDFAGGKMNYFAPEHCPGKVVYWPAAAAAAVRMLFRDLHLNLDVSLDGHRFRAMIDTGAPNTTISMAEASRVFGIRADNKDEAFGHVFQKLSFDGLEVANPRILVLPDKMGSKDPNNSFVTGSRVHRVDDRDPSDPDMLIGMNILSKLHLYIAFSENKIYFTPASAPAPAQQ